ERILKTIDSLYKRIHGNRNDPGSIFLIGHSAGGAAVLQALRTLKEQNSPALDLIYSGIAIDSPVGDAALKGGELLGFRRYQYEWGPVGIGSRDLYDHFGKWADQKSIKVLTVSFDQDWFNNISPVADIPAKIFSSNINPANPHGFLVQGGAGPAVFDWLWSGGWLR
ncbi:MAG: hypothetical protein C4294_19095, partial [Nitrospiraceae bacterium]